MKEFYLFVTALLLGGALSAQSNLRGLFVHLDGHATALQYEDYDAAEPTYGYGFGGKLGYGFGTTTLYLGTGVTRLEGLPATRFAGDYRARVAELGARFHFGRRSGSVIPYAALAARFVTSTPYEGVNTRGGGLSVAPGLLVYLSDNLALDARVQLAGTYVYDADQLAIDLLLPRESYSYATAGFHLGVTFYPSVRRARYRFERGGGHL